MEAAQNKALEALEAHLSGRGDTLAAFMPAALGPGDPLTGVAFIYRDGERGDYWGGYYEGGPLTGLIRSRVSDTLPPALIWLDTRQWQRAAYLPRRSPGLRSVGDGHE